MADSPGPDSEGSIARQDTYSVGYGERIQRWHSRRTAAERAEFLLPHLRPGMALLDCGCGPGTITVGLAQVVAPGRVVGVDREWGQVERARRLAAERGVERADFVVGDAYALPLDRGTVDAVFAHNVLEHVSDPLSALREMRRVLRPGGVIGVRDPDYGAGVWEPSTPLLMEASQLLLRVRTRNGGSPYYARHQRQLLIRAGFRLVRGFAYAECQATPEDTATFAGVVAEVLRAEATVEAALGEGWADRDRLEALAAEVLAWGRRPDAFRALVDCAAVGWAADGA